MKRVNIAELKNRLSRYLDHVRAGGTVVVLDRTVPVARIVPLHRTEAGADARDDHLRRLERQGAIRRGSGRLPEWLGRRRPPRLRGSVLDDLRRERESGW